MSTLVVKSISYRTGDYTDNVKSVNYDSVNVADHSDLEILESKLRNEFRRELIPLQENLAMLKKLVEESFAENRRLRAYLQKEYEARLKAEENALYEIYGDIAEKLSRTL